MLPKHFISKVDLDNGVTFGSYLPNDIKEELENLRSSSSYLKNVDPTVLYAIKASRLAFKDAKWDKGEDIGINIGSSRGATQLFEKYYKNFLETGSAGVLSSPSTTLGNISSWVSQDIQSHGPDISHSVTCSTGLHALLNGVAWLNAGMASKFMVGGSEAALTPFTIAQMKAMKIYAKEDLDYPCRALDLGKTKNSMVLGEAAGIACLELHPETYLAKIAGVGYSTEKLKHSVSISANAECFQRSMKMAVGNIPLDEIDVIVMHAPGTIKGDMAEVNAVRKVFGENIPALTSNKWKVGHTFGASGILSLQLAIMMLQHEKFIPVPFAQTRPFPKHFRNILINAVGFGGNAVSILVNKG